MPAYASSITCTNQPRLPSCKRARPFRRIPRQARHCLAARRKRANHITNASQGRIAARSSIPPLHPVPPASRPPGHGRPHHRQSISIMMAPNFEVMGDEALCAWQPVPGFTWIQTRCPAHARRLSQRKDGRLVAWSIVGGYLRTFEFHRSRAWAQALLKRYQAAQAIDSTLKGHGESSCRNCIP